MCDLRHPKKIDMERHIGTTHQKRLKPVQLTLAQGRCATTTSPTLDLWGGRGIVHNVACRSTTDPQVPPAFTSTAKVITSTYLPGTEPTMASDTNPKASPQVVPVNSGMRTTTTTTNNISTPGDQNTSVLERPDSKTEDTDLELQEPVLFRVCTGSSDLGPEYYVQQEQIDRTVDIETDNILVLNDILVLEEAYVLLNPVYKCRLCSWYGWKMVHLRKHYCAEHGQDLEDVEGNESGRQSVKHEDQCSTTGNDVHHRRHSNDKQYSCQICKKDFTNLGHPTCHSRTHSEEKPFHCKFCSKRFNTAWYLAMHLRTHSGEKPFRCKVCSKRFHQSRYLTVHLRSHGNENPYTCNICNKTFSRSDALSRHVANHSGKKSFICTICKTAFSQSYALIRHARIHSNEKPFTCKICNKGFRWSDKLTRHLRTHGNEKPL